MTLKSSQSLRAELDKRVLVLDGAMGTRLLARQSGPAGSSVDGKAGFPVVRAGNLDLLTLTRPELVADIHISYIEAGADIISTNTFCSNAVDQARFGTGSIVRQLNLEAARLARRIVDEYADGKEERTRFVAGVIGPTVRSVSRPSDGNREAFAHIDFEDLREACVEPVRALLEGGVDVLLVESVYDLQNLKAILAAIDDIRTQSGSATPVWVSLTVTDNDGRLLSGETVDEVWRSVRDAGIFCIGLNCSFGARSLGPRLKQLSDAADIAVAVHPNAGLPDVSGCYGETPQVFAGTVSEYARGGWANIVGGCCGTTDEHIRALAKSVTGIVPRQIRV